MTSLQIQIFSSDNADLASFLGDRLYEFNADATGIRDGELLWASITDEAGAIVAGISGHTWGGCCEIGRLWVEASQRGKGFGSALMTAAEAEAVRRGCTQVVLSTHSFQAPAFYEKLGYERLASIPNYPRGHEHVLYIKDLAQSQLLCR